jgi:hypothetical protein
MSNSKRRISFIKVSGTFSGLEVMNGRNWGQMMKFYD